MDESLQPLENRLRAFRPLGEAQLVEAALARLVEAAVEDAVLRQRLKSNPKALLAASGLTVGPGLEIEVHEENRSVFHLLVPLGEVPVNEYLPETAAILEEARHDPDFEKDLRDNPRRIFEDRCGVHLPPAAEISVLKNTFGRLHLILPMEERLGELSDLELDLVAGGSGNPFRYPGSKSP